jgi:hypothetical protein
MLTATPIAGDLPVGRNGGLEVEEHAERAAAAVDPEAREVLRFGIVRPAACLFLTQDIRREGGSP